MKKLIYVSLLIVALFAISTLQSFAANGDSRTIRMEKQDGYKSSTSINNVSGNLDMQGINLGGSQDAIRVRTIRQINNWPDSVEKSSGWIQVGGNNTDRVWDTKAWKASTQNVPYYIEIATYWYDGIGQGTLWD